MGITHPKVVRGVVCCDQQQKIGWNKILTEFHLLLDFNQLPTYTTFLTPCARCVHTSSIIVTVLRPNKLTFVIL